MDGRVIGDVTPCSIDDVRQVAGYLASTPVAEIGTRLIAGQGRLGKAAVTSLGALGALKTLFGKIGPAYPPERVGASKFIVSEVLPVLNAHPCPDPEMLASIKGLLRADESEIDPIVTILRIGQELVIADGNKRSIAFYERRRDGADAITYPVFVVEGLALGA